MAAMHSAARIARPDAPAAMSAAVVSTPTSAAPAMATMAETAERHTPSRRASVMLTSAARTMPLMAAPMASRANAVSPPRGMPCAAASTMASKAPPEAPPMMMAASAVPAASRLRSGFIVLHVDDDPHGVERRLSHGLRQRRVSVDGDVHFL